MNWSLKPIISSSDKSFLKNALYHFDFHWVLGTANVINMEEQLMIMISKFKKYTKKWINLHHQKHFGLERDNHVFRVFF